MFTFTITESGTIEDKDGEAVTLKTVIATLRAQRDAARVAAKEAKDTAKAEKVAAKKLKLEARAQKIAAELAKLSQ